MAACASLTCLDLAASAQDVTNLELAALTLLESLHLDSCLSVKPGLTQQLCRGLDRACYRVSHAAIALSLQPTERRCCFCVHQFNKRVM